MTRSAAIAAILVVSALMMASAAEAQQFTNPIRYTWIAESVDHWNKAASALALSGGDGTVIAVPTGREATPWILIRRVEEGSVYIPDDEPHLCNVFKTMGEASSRALSMSPCHNAMLLSVPGGESVVISLRECSTNRRRSVR